jgi:hypothetical protein
LDPQGCTDQATFTEHPVGGSLSCRVDVHGLGTGTKSFACITFESVVF